MSKETKSSQKASVSPLGDRVLIKETKAEEGRKTVSGIIIPETVNEDKGAKKGKVIAVGKGRYDDGKIIPMEVKVGDEVLFQWGDMIKIEGEEYYIVSEGSVMAVIR